MGQSLERDFPTEDEDFLATSLIEKHVEFTSGSDAQRFARRIPSIPSSTQQLVQSTFVGSPELGPLRNVNPLVLPSVGTGRRISSTEGCLTFCHLPSTQVHDPYTSVKSAPKSLQAARGIFAEISGPPNVHANSGFWRLGWRSLLHLSCSKIP